MVKKVSASKKAPSSKTKGHLVVPVHSVVHFVKMLHDEGHADNFIAAAKKRKAVMTLHADSVEFVKAFLKNKKLHQAMILKIVDPCPGDPFECHFRD